MRLGLTWPLAAAGCLSLVPRMIMTSCHSKQPRIPPPLPYLPAMSVRLLPAGFIAPCLPIKATALPSGGLWLHEIKHDGFRVIARKDEPVNFTH